MLWNKFLPHPQLAVLFRTNQAQYLSNSTPFEIVLGINDLYTQEIFGSILYDSSATKICLG
jgi:hypothetical protein